MRRKRSPIVNIGLTVLVVLICIGLLLPSFLAVIGYLSF